MLSKKVRFLIFAKCLLLLCIITRSISVLAASDSLAIALSSPNNTIAQSNSVIPSGGELITPDNAILTASIVGQQHVNTRLIQVTHQDFNNVLEINVSQPRGEFWRSQIQIPTISAVSKDDVLLVRLFMRTTNTLYENGNGFVTVFMEGQAPKHTKYLQREITSDQQWVEYLLPFVVGQSFSAGTFPLKLGLGAGDRAQTAPARVR